ncbi:MAG TPA: shikimate dehydrogenase [Cryomorphaceae bacterium]|nr:shikimate dehydrogenase [Owenweeksia sp.]MBG00393.1 shikimate dehydrogenase [Owenweeksia sp.]HAD97689.1 shikimate dehydrogenase [Cryomorphaceae bacterium]HBF21359.1 shikimate dehydrogenase [Cryomorphaceae bacterium]HCQ17466.1 shikimate dehydrogenase [Cryomorphaceae bacterium]|tara:strand:- start:79 stop:804 length:726 start_codon:yes stop_codon:yes gene_type:complete
MEFGLIGRSLRHSFSKDHFTRKFREMGLGHTYSNFELDTIQAFPELVRQHPGLKGLNVTIPYKEQIIPFLDSVSKEASQIGAVNTIRIQNGKYHGYNTDVFGFEKSLAPLLRPQHQKALILGTGGASKAVAFVLRKLGITATQVSRKPSADRVNYEEAGRLLEDHLLVINCTPLGTFPGIEDLPPLAMDRVGNDHVCYDLIYNPPRTKWLQKAAQKGSKIKNGQEMLELQAEKAWEIWNEF